MTALIIILIYIIGIFVAAGVIAWINTSPENEGISWGYSALSWIMVMIISVFVFLIPVKAFYDWCYKKFNKKYTIN